MAKWDDERMSFMTKSAPGFHRSPDYRIDIEPCPRRVRVKFGKTLLADSTKVLVMLENNQVPVYYFPRNDLVWGNLQASELTTYCPFKGAASYWSVNIGGTSIDDAVWSYEDPFQEALMIKDHMAFYWHKADHWYEEDEEVYVHPRDPYKRVDAIRSKRPVKVVLGGLTVAESVNAVYLFETGMPTRYYIPATDVRLDLLKKSESSTQCPYKGIADYWSADINGTIFDDIAWRYPEPLAACAKIQGLYCFYNENVDELLIEGTSVGRPATKWSR